MSDVFHTMRFRGTNDFAGQHSAFTMRWEAQQVKLNFVFRFGRNQIKAARNRVTGAEDESKRANQQGGGIGIGGQ
jgi:iron complex outermembrane recepter protein